MEKVPRKYRTKRKEEAGLLLAADGGASASSNVLAARAGSTSTRGGKKKRATAAANSATGGLNFDLNHPSNQARTIVAANPFDDEPAPSMHHHNLHQQQYVQAQHQPAFMHYDQAQPPMPLPPNQYQGPQHSRVPQHLHQQVPTPPLHMQTLDHGPPPLPHHHHHNQQQQMSFTTPPLARNGPSPLYSGAPLAQPPPPPQAMAPNYSGYSTQASSPPANMHQQQQPPPPPPPIQHPQPLVHQAQQLEPIHYQPLQPHLPTQQQQIPIQTAPNSAPITTMKQSPAPTIPQHQHQHQQLHHNNHQQQQQPVNLAYCAECRQPIYPNELRIMCRAGCDDFYHRHCSGLTELACELLLRESAAEWACNRCIYSERRIPVVRVNQQPDFRQQVYL